MKLTEIFFELLQYPNSPKPYRQMRDLYRKMGKIHESNAFTHLLEVKFKKLPDDNNNNNNKKS
jgi:hypothetical protein